MPIYSYSQLETYEQCPLKYKFRYRDKIKRYIESVEAFMGSRVHDTLQKCYDDIRYTRKNNLNDLVAFYDKIWQKNWNDSIVITRQDLTQEHYRALGQKLIESYYKRYSPFDTDITVQTEMRIAFSLDDAAKYRMQGYIDRLSRTYDGTYEIHDYKTSAHLPGQADVDKDRQLGLYQIGVQKRWPDVKNIRLIWHYLAFNTELVSYRTSEAIASLIEKTKRLINEIESIWDFLPRESHLCDWCEYTDLCPLRKHFVKVEALPMNEYLNEPGVVLANKYAELKEQEVGIKDEMEKVREAILDYARKEEVEVIKGNDHKITITFDEKLKFPGKKDAECLELDALIKEAGRWDEVSELDITTLGRIIERDMWSKDLIDKVVKYGRIEEGSMLRLSKLKDE